MSKRALITGIAGQDGSYLSEYLLHLGYEVHGILRRHSVAEHQDWRIRHLVNYVTTHYGDVTDAHSISHLVQEIQPDEIYNLAGQSHVQISFKVPDFTIQTNTLGVLNVLEAVRLYKPDCKVYQASSSEVFGDSCDEDLFQREDTRKTPVSPYGCSKLMAYHLIRNYRKSYNLFASNGILFNHSSPRRGMNFVEQKIIYGVARIKLELADKLELGNTHSFRDFGHSKDYVRAMHAILQNDTPDDFVVSTGQTKSIQDVVDYVFNSFGLEQKDHLVISQNLIRPQELPYLRGDSTKIRTTIGWSNNYTAEKMFDEMIESAILHLEAELAARPTLELLEEISY